MYTMKKLMFLTLLGLASFQGLRAQQDTNPAPEHVGHNRTPYENGQELAKRLRSVFSGTDVQVLNTYGTVTVLGEGYTFFCDFNSVDYPGHIPVAKAIFHRNDGEAGCLVEAFRNGTQEMSGYIGGGLYVWDLQADPEVPRPCGGIEDTGGYEKFEKFLRLCESIIKP